MIRLTTVSQVTYSSNPTPVREPNTRLGPIMLQWVALIGRLNGVVTTQEPR